MVEKERREMLMAFREWAAWEIDRGFWTQEDASDIGAAIDEAIKTGNEEVIDCWRRFIDTQVEEIRRMKGLARAAYDRIVADIRAGVRPA